MSSKIEGMRIFRLVLKFGFHLDLKNTFYIPSFSRNLVSIARLVHFGFKFVFENSNFILFQNDIVVGNGFLVNGLYKFNLEPTCECNILIM